MTDRDREIFNRYKTKLVQDIADYYELILFPKTKNLEHELECTQKAAIDSLSGITHLAEKHPELRSEAIDYIDTIISLCNHNYHIYKVRNSASPIPTLKFAKADLEALRDKDRK